MELLTLVKAELKVQQSKAGAERKIHNTSIEQLVLDSNAISGQGIKAIFAGLGKNSSVKELQIRHQSRTMSSTDEEALPGLLSSNTSILKVGIDSRNKLVKMQLDRKTDANRDRQRKLRAQAKKG